MSSRIEKFAAVAEVVSAFAVVVTLIVLIGQVSENTAAVRAASAAASRDSLAEMTDQTLSYSDELLELMVRATDPALTLDDFSEVERLRLHSNQRSFFRRAEAQYFRYRSKLLDEDAWITVRNRVVANIESPVDHEIWERDKRTVYTPGFAAAIDPFLTAPAVSAD